jgi:hypothetical protein
VGQTELERPDKRHSIALPIEDGGMVLGIRTIELAMSAGVGCRTDKKEELVKNVGSS